MNREEYIDLFHRAEVNLVAFNQIFHCDEELRKMVEMAIEAEREACAKVCEEQMQGKSIWVEGARACSLAIRARGQA